MKSELARASAFEEAMRDAAVERTVPSRFGTALFNDTLPVVWSLNCVRVEATEAGVGELVDEIHRVQEGLPHRRMVVTDEALGREIEEPLRELGWKTEAFLFMVPRKQPEQPARDVQIEEVTQSDLAPLRRRILEEWLIESDDETVRQVTEMDRLYGEIGNARHFAVLSDGEIVSSTSLFSDGRTAQIEDVATLPEHRGQGYARALVLHALTEARAGGHDFVFLVADARDWPKELYRRLGFEPVGEKYDYLLHPLPE
jgi:ribosomal protein S18 acetylase RimI-like enzyme